MALKLFFILLVFQFLAQAQTFGPSPGTSPGMGTGTINSGVTVVEFDQSTFSRAEGPRFGDPLAVNTTIFGGTAGGATAGGCATKTASNTCNNCSGGDIPCNAKRIHDDLLFTVTIKLNSEGRLFVSDTNANPTYITPDFPLNENQIHPAGTVLPLRIKWKKICDTILQSEGGGGCEGDMTNAVRRMRIGVYSGTNPEQGTFTEEVQFSVATMEAEHETTDLCKESGTIPSGICNFIAYPGDSKIFLEDVRANCTFPELPNGARARFVRVFKREVTNPTAIVYPMAADANPTTLELGRRAETCTGSQSVNLTKSEVTGLTNGKPYAFSVAIVDQAENVGFLTDTATMGAAALDDESACFDPDEWPTNCHATTPDEVIGLIEDEFDCFITTATYGTALRPKVKTFRQFRNQFLKTHWLGRKIINTYYAYSPPLAKWIHDHPESRSYMRIVLWPLWAFAKVCLDFPLALLALMSAGLVFFTRRRITGVLK